MTGHDGGENVSDSSAPVIETTRLIIRRATLDDAEMFLRLWTDPRVMRNVGFPQGLKITREEVRDLIAGEKTGVLDRLLVVADRETGTALGECKLGVPDDRGIAETDVKLLPETWGRRFGVEIKRALVDYLFTHTDCRIVQATPNVDNPASIRMQEAVGGVRVGEDVFEPPATLRDQMVNVHHYVYHVTREAWLKRRNASPVDDPH